MGEIDDSRGILTSTDREFLWADPEERIEEYSRSARSQRRSAIRSRLATGLWDLRVINEHLPASDRQRVFRSLEEEGMSMVRLGPMMNDAWAFIVLGVLEQRDLDFDDESFYEDLLRNVIRTVLYEKGHGADEIEVDVTIEGWDSAEYDPSEHLSDHSEERLRSLLFQGDITLDELVDEMNRRREETTDPGE